MIIFLFILELGVIFNNVLVVYKIWGKFNEKVDNCLVICYVLIGSVDVEDWYVILFVLWSSEG